MSYTPAQIKAAEGALLYYLKMNQDFDPTRYERLEPTGDHDDLPSQLDGMISPACKGISRVKKGDHEDWIAVFEDNDGGEIRHVTMAKAYPVLV